MIRANSTTKSPWLALITAMVAIFMMVPMVLSTMAALVENYSQGLKSGLTLRWIHQVLEQYGSTVTWSLAIAMACVLGNIILGVPAAYALANSRSKWARTLEEILTLPVAIPGLATGLALILAYGTWRDFRQSYVFILVGHMVFTLPFMVRTVAAAFQRPDMHAIDEAAKTLGAGFLRRFIGVLVPAVLPAIAAGSLMVFTLSIGEFNLTWMLHTPMTRTLPVGLADSYASMRLEIGSAYTLVFFLVVLPILWLLQWCANVIEQRYGK